MKFKKKISAKAVILIVLVVGLLVGGVGYLSKGYTDMDVEGWIYERNPENLLNYEMDVFNVNEGVKTTVDKYGVINIKGYIAETTKTEEYTYSLGRMTLPAGTYTFSTIDRNSSTNTFVLYGEYDGGVWYADNDRTMTKTFEAPTEIFFKIGINKGDCEVDFTIQPVLVEGSEPLEEFLVTRSYANKD